MVTTQEAYDVYTFGRQSPDALDALINDVASGGNLAAVFLIGAGSTDYRNLQGTNDDLVPVRLLQLPEALFAVDQLYANGGSLVVGRLPAHTEAEVDSYRAKVEAFESGEGPWRDRVVFAADNADRGGDFASDSDSVAGTLSGFDLGKVYLGVTHAPAASARTALIDEILAGTRFVHYLGHGGLDRMASEGLLRSTDVGALTGAPTPIVLGLTCNLALFAIPGFPSLGSQLVLADGGGAVVVWSSAGRSINETARGLGAGFFSAVQGGASSMADGVTAALAGNDDQSTKSVYEVLGDPSVRLDPR
jgi:Peptidase family C25